MIITFQGLLEAKNGLDYLLLLVVDQPFVVMSSRGLIFLDRTAVLEIVQGFLIFLLLVIDYASLFIANMAHISIESYSKRFDSLIIVPKLFLTSPFA